MYSHLTFFRVSITKIPLNICLMINYQLIKCKKKKKKKKKNPLTSPQIPSLLDASYSNNRESHRNKMSSDGRDMLRSLSVWAETTFSFSLFKSLSPFVVQMFGLKILVLSLQEKINSSFRNLLERAFGESGSLCYCVGFCYYFFYYGVTVLAFVVGK